MPSQPPVSPLALSVTYAPVGFWTVTDSRPGSDCARFRTNTAATTAKMTGTIQRIGLRGGLEGRRDVVVAVMHFLQAQITERRISR